MDLTKYTNNKKTNKDNNKKEVIIDNSDIKIVKIANEVEFFIKTKKGLKKYQDYLFFGVTNAIKTDKNDEAQQFFEQSIKRGVEGLMFKNVKSVYKPGLRTGAMAKLKETKEEIDVVILAAEHGRGKRAGYYSSFYVGVKNEDYNNKKDKFLTVGKVSSGILEIGSSGHSMDNLTNLLKPLKISEQNGVVYFEPKIVLEIKYQEIQKSSIYDSGYALRFPRIVSLREDKDLEEINTIEYIDKFAQKNI
jgi:DNA ligase-1